MRIVVASDHLPPHRSGHAVAAAWWIRALADAGHELTVVGDAPPLPDVAVRWRRLPVLPGFTPGHPLAAFRPPGRALAGLMDDPPDVLHLHGYGPACRTAWAALPGVPTVVTLHAFPDGSGAPVAPVVVPVMRKLLTTMLDRARRITVPSDAARRMLEDLLGPEAGRDRVDVLPVGVDPVFAPAARPSSATDSSGSTERRTFLYVGRRSRAKGFDLFARLAHAHPEHDWHAIGDGPGGPDTPYRITPHAGPREVAAALYEADALLAPGPHETQGLVALEALHCGTAVAVPRGSAQAEVVTDGRQGRTYRPRDDEAAWEALRTAAELTRANAVRPPPGFERDALLDRMVGTFLRAMEDPDPAS